jgi:hypothetical protein
MMTEPFDDQMEIFPTKIEIERLDPRKVVGDRTIADALYRVRIGEAGPPHLVFIDRHGIYCQDHGPECRAAREVSVRRGEGGPAQPGLGF